MLRQVLTACLLPLALTGCVQTKVHAEQPAVFKAGDAASHAVLQSSLQRALGRPVTLAQDALVNESALVIEPVPARIDGQRIDGRDRVARAERFTLWRVDDRCVLRRESTGERLALPGAACVTPVAVRPAARSCDRACLSGFVTAYLEALASRQPSRLPLSGELRYTENGVAVPMGEALWATVTGIGTYRVDYADTDAGQIAAHVSFVEGDRAGLMSLRLRIEGGQISEIETVLNRGAPMATRMPPVEAVWTQVEPESTRLTREQLAAEAENYLKAVSRSDGRLVKFHPDSCLRLENGNVMAHGPHDAPAVPLPPVADAGSWQAAVRQTLGMDCAAQLSTGIYGFITSYDNARFPVIDVERQVVFGQWNFRRRGDVPGVTFRGRFYPFMDSMRFPNENLLGQAFKFRDGRILRVQGVFLNANVYRAGTGWDLAPR
jgi:hypothetical protein